MKNIISENPLVVCGVVLVGVSLVSGGFSSLKETASAGNALKAQRREISVSKNLQKIAEEESAIASQRYQNGCVFVVASNQPDTFTGLQEGKEVLDGATGHPLSDGVTVCDYNGLTGIIQEGVVASTAFTGDRETIEAALTRAGIARNKPNSKQGGDHDGDSN